ncbi:alpha/beta fold hydrolase [Nocardia sp. 2]|uniref:Alpha/beta fold hydrolase n=1 Tax=Nocardia acididurans TaxID=2802282 RepID=A0ABS1LZU4_9NOCA|nr:alpha/beta fold hydrolase [Nocardia acididurans]MBL1073781.1 alpha/beta fold hydrolase [Nocardia acididurans]
MEDGGSARFVADGVHAEVAGSGPPVVFTHDALSHSGSWDAQFEALAAGYRVARWDRRGYGRTPRPTGPYSSSADLAAVVRAVSPEPATLVGCSFGGLITLWCALEHPELVGRLVLIGSLVSGLSLSEHFLTRGGRDIPTHDDPVPEQIAYWTETDPWFVAPSNPAARQRLREMLDNSPGNLTPPMELERMSQESALARLGEITVPTLLIVGDLDHPDVHAHAGAIEGGIAGAQRVVLGGCGHLPQLETPAACTTVLREFLDETA